MDLVWIFRLEMIHHGSDDGRWELWCGTKGKQKSSHMASCKSYAPGFRLVTLESAREDYGIKVTRIVEAIGKERRS